MKHQAMHDALTQARECLSGAKKCYTDVFFADSDVDTLQATGITKELGKADTAIWDAIEALNKAQRVIEEDAK